MYHRIGAGMQPTVSQTAEGVPPQYGQLYIYDAAQAAQQRMGHVANSDCSPDLMRSLSELIVRVNVYAAAYRMLGDIANEEREEHGHESATHCHDGTQRSQAAEIAVMWSAAIQSPSDHMSCLEVRVK